MYSDGFIFFPTNFIFHEQAVVVADKIFDGYVTNLANMRPNRGRRGIRMPGARTKDRNPNNAHTHTTVKVCNLILQFNYYLLYIINNGILYNKGFCKVVRALRMRVLRIDIRRYSLSKRKAWPLLSNDQAVVMDVD